MKVIQKFDPEKDRWYTGNTMMKYRLAETCSEEGCTHYIWNLKRRLCLTHTSLFSRNNKQGECSLDWCDKRLYARGLCNQHYTAQREGRELIDPRIPKPKCAFDPCDRQAAAGPFCKGHYAQRWAGKELTPLRPSRPRKELHGEDGGLVVQRQCKTCGQWKEQEAGFYRSANKKAFQSECKTCHVKRSSARQTRKKLERKGLLSE